MKNDDKNVTEHVATNRLHFDVMRENLRMLRKAHRLTLRDLENITGISNATLSQIETGQRKNHSIEIIARLCEYFNVSFDDFIYKRIKDIETDIKIKTFITWTD